MLNYIWLILILGAVALGSFNGRLKEVTEGAIESSKTAVTLSIGLIGIMALWLGVMRLAEKAGLIQKLARGLRPLLRWLFPEVPVEHPAMGSMVMNIAANVLGLTNAATPFGIRAMRDLESLNPHPGVATNAMCTFLAINTGSVQLIPVTAIAILAAAGSREPTAIVGTALAATFFSSLAGLMAVKTFQRFAPLPAVATRQSEHRDVVSEPAAAITAPPILSAKGRVAIIATIVGFLSLIILHITGAHHLYTPEPGQGAWIQVINGLSVLAIPFLLSIIPLYAALLKLPVYEEFVEGAKEGFNVAIRIIPFLVAMLAAIGMFRQAGGIDLITQLTAPLLNLVGFPSELLPMAFMRPLSGSGSLGIFSELVKAFGPDSMIARMAGTIYGSTETTFYVIAVYFGAVGVHRTRHAIPAGLVADAAGVIASIIICRLAFG